MSDDCKTAITRVELERENKQLREVIALELELRDKALKLQAAEYERRLEVLNGAAARAEKATEMTVPRIEYNKFVSDITKWQNEISAEIGATRATSVSNMRFFTIVVSLIGLVFTAISLWNRFK